MSRVLIVGYTHMHQGHVCIGGHDVDQTFRSVRLLNGLIGEYWLYPGPFRVGELWDIEYRYKWDVRPHVEDAFVTRMRRIRLVGDLANLLRKRVTPWCGGPYRLFEGMARRTPHGGGYIPEGRRLPGCSTGYWEPDQPLSRYSAATRTRFAYDDGPLTMSLPWVGVANPPEAIPAGSLVRVSLTRSFKAAGSPEGYYIQISGVFLPDDRDAQGTSA